MSAGFKLRQSSHELKVEELTISSETLSPGDLVDQAVGATTFAAATSSSLLWTRKAVVTESATTSDTKVQAIMIDSNQLWEVESADSSSTGDNGDAMVLTDKNTVNNTGTNSTAKEALVVQVSTAGAASEKRIIVRFTGTSSGIGHDAA